MPGPLPDGEPVPASGTLPPGTATSGPLGAYVHVPFCAVRCGYCDFNTYTASELAGGVTPESYPALVHAEVALAGRVLGPDAGPLETVFFGGGTPSLLPAGALLGVLERLSARFGVAGGAEVTLEANPDSVSPEQLSALARGGVNRISLGMQSAVPHVLAALDRTHRPEALPEAVDAAREAGIRQVSVDLIYGAPGESDDDWRRSLEAALALGPDHVSAYALTVEPGTRFSARIRRGELAPVDDDVLADRYLIADEVLTAAGYRWYEVSNWARAGDARCRHNLGYWTGANWWGFGPGAHSHVGGVRWWNVRHPSEYARRLGARASPAAAREMLDGPTRELERVMLELRLADGLPNSGLDGAALARLAGDGLLEPRPDRAVLTTRGRLLADAVVRELTG